MACRKIQSSEYSPFHYAEDCLRHFWEPTVLCLRQRASGLKALEICWRQREYKRTLGLEDSNDVRRTCFCIFECSKVCKQFSNLKTAMVQEK